jgi:acyl-coenzyme A synthetase/AMP-(fatty) acid ligase
VSEGKPPLNHKALIQHCRANLASFKVPQKLIELAELPKTTSGKIKKNLLVNKYAQTLNPEPLNPPRSPHETMHTLYP